MIVKEELFVVLVAGVDVCTDEASCKVELANGGLNCCEDGVVGAGGVQGAVASGHNYLEVGHKITGCFALNGEVLVEGRGTMPF